MKTFSVTILFCTSLIAGVIAQAPQNPNVPDPPQRTIQAGSHRDGFAVRDSAVFMSRDGVTTKVEREIIFPNGLRVLPDGRVTLRDGSETTLLAGQWLNFEGSIDELAVAAGASKATTPANRESGVSSRDGFTVSGADVFITRHGATEKVSSETRLPNGVIVNPDGSVVMADGKKITLRAEQVLDLQGVLHESPIKARPAGVEPSSNPAK